MVSLAAEAARDSCTVWTWSPHSRPDDLLQFVEMDAGDRKDEIQASVRQARLERSSFQKEGVPGEVGVDIVVSNLKLTSDGNDSSGYRIRVFGMSDKPQAALVARRPAGYRIVAFGGDVRMVGPEVLRRLDANDLKGAKQWLDWAREEQVLQGGDDPLAGPVLPRFWTRGDEPNPDKMRLAAVALMLNSAAIQGHVKDLKAARARAAEADQTKLDLALAALGDCEVTDNIG
jgi:hypothetical protein